jgi:hypothetical protein
MTSRGLTHGSNHLAIGLVYVDFDAVPELTT